MDFDRIQQIAIILQTSPGLFTPKKMSDEVLSKINTKIESMCKEYGTSNIGTLDRQQIDEIYYTLGIADERLSRIEESTYNHYHEILRSYDHYVYAGRQEYLKNEEKNRRNWIEFSKYYGNKFERAMGMKYLFGRFIDLSNFSIHAQIPISFSTNHAKKRITYTDNANKYKIILEPGHESPILSVDTTEMNHIQYYRNIPSLESAFRL